MTRLKDGLSARGVFKMVVRKNGKIIETYEDHNLIVNKARVLMSHLLAGDVTGHSIGKIAFGTNGSAPTVDDTNIANAFTKNLSGSNYPTDGVSVRFSWNLLTTEDNGQAIMEFGLMSADGTLFARKTRSSAINKAEDISIEGTWTIIF